MEIRQPSPQDRFQVLETPRMAPGQCGICGSAKKPMVDFGMSFIGYGRFYICVEDMASAARAIGYVPAVDAEEAVDSIVQNYLAETGQSLVRSEDASLADSIRRDFVALSERLNALSTPQDAPVVDETSGASEGERLKVRRSGHRRTVRGTDEVDVDSLVQDSVGVSEPASDESEQLTLI